MADKKSLVNIDFGGSSSIKGLPSATAASGDYIVLTDTSDGGKAKKGPSFATNDGKFLRHDGSWIAALPLSGGKMTGHLQWADSNALPSATAAGLTNGLQFILGIKSFADGGDTVYETKANFLNGCVFYTAQTLTDAQKAQARANIGVVQKYRHHCTFEWSSGSGSNQYIGSLSFFFDDTYADSYYDEDYGSSGILAFIKNHCNMPDNKTSYLSVTGGGTVGVEVASPYRHSEVFIAQALINDHGSWYYNGLYYAKTNNFGNFNPTYALGAYPTFLPSNGVAVLYDNVEPL